MVEIEGSVIKDGWAIFVKIMSVLGIVTIPIEVYNRNVDQ